MDPSVIYHDEPRFLKNARTNSCSRVADREGGKSKQELKWMMAHTAKLRPVAKAIEGAEPHQDKTRSLPEEMIPSQPAIVKVPSSDVRVKTVEAEQYDVLASVVLDVDMGGMILTAKK